MNYIHQLQAEIKTLEQDKADAHAALAELRDYLNLPKFKGTDERDGSLKNYVNIDDVLTRLTPALSATLKG